MISIITIYNDEAILKNYLLKSLKHQTVEFELATIDNMGNFFPSAAEALNYGGLRAKGEYIMFAHQDTFLLSNDWLEKAESILDEQDTVGAAGVAGMRDMKVKMGLKVGRIFVDSGIGNVFHGVAKEPWNCNKEFSGPEEVQTLDELVLIVPRRVFEILHFDSKTCDGWHLYGVDYSLSVRQMNLKSYVLPLPVWHLSTGSIDEDYYKTLRKVLFKHKKCKKLYTTCGFWHTNHLFNLLELFTMACKGEVGKWIGLNDHGADPYMSSIKAFLA